MPAVSASWAEGLLGGFFLGMLGEKALEVLGALRQFLSLPFGVEVFLKAFPYSGVSPPLPHDHTAASENLSTWYLTKAGVPGDHLSPGGARCGSSLKDTNGL